MHGRTLLAAIVACAVPVVLAGNALLVLAWHWLPRAVYALPGFPAEDGLSSDRRLELAGTGIDAIQPWDAGGLDRLREARLPTGSDAFNARELAHMQDVRELMTLLLITWAVSLAALAFMWLAARRRPGPRAAIRTGLGWGARATIALLGVIGVFMLVNFDAFFDVFHAVFFTGDSWRFPRTDTLRRLFPYSFWGIAGGALALLTIGQALVIARLAGRADRHPPARPPVTA